MLQTYIIDHELRLKYNINIHVYRFETVYTLLLLRSKNIENLYGFS